MNRGGTRPSRKRLWSLGALLDAVLAAAGVVALLMVVASLVSVWTLVALAQGWPT